MGALLGRIVQRLRNHHLRQRLGGAVLGQAGAGQAAVQFGAEAHERFQAGELHARAGFEGMRFVGFSHIGAGPGGAVDAGDDAFKGLELLRGIAGTATGVVPGWVPVVAVNQFGADAADFAGGAGALHMAEVGEEVHEARQAFGQGGICRALLFEFKHVEDELPRGQQPAKGVGQRESHALAALVVELGAVGVGGSLQMVERP